MEPDVISSWAWVLWLALVLVFVVVEARRLDFVFLTLALGAVGGLVTGLMGAAWWLQLIVATALGLVLLLLVRPVLLRILRTGGRAARPDADDRKGG